MKRVFRHVTLGARRLAQHPLFTEWLANDAVAARDKLAFCPVAIDFVMGFRDLNRYFVRYPQPRGPLEEALNEHAAEDATHSGLFVTDWERLGVDDRLGWAPRDLYWWITCDQTVGSRRLDFELTRMVFENEDPLLRFAIIEAMEAAGNVFFRRTVPVAEVLEAELGVALPYFGTEHLARETGHLQGEVDERAFLRELLDEERLGRAIALVDRVYAIFDAHFAEWLRFAREQREGRWSFSPADDAARLAGLRAEPVDDVTAAMELEHPRDASGRAAELVALRARAYEEIWESPFYRWVRRAWPGDFGRMTRSFFLQWVVDNWTCADWFAFDTTYPDPKTPLERGINRLSTLYASEMNRRYQEWEALQLDAFTGWTAREALRHYWLDERVEEHREVFADLRKLTFRHPEPLYRYWIMKCFVRFGDGLMRSMGAAMERAGVPEEDFVGFAGRAARLHPELPPDPEADAAILELEAREPTGEELLVIRRIIEETKEQELRRSDISWSVIHEKRYRELDRRWQRVRDDVHEVKVSEIVDATADEAWDILGDFGGAARWAGPTLESCTVEGSGVGAVRRMVGGGLAIAERLVAYDPEERTLAYDVVGPTPLPISDYVSTIRVLPEGDGRCRIEWIGRFEPAGAPAEVGAGIVRKVYGDGIEGVRRALAG
jgi:hypothetical protein